jgi:hypothetical protein
MLKLIGATSPLFLAATIAATVVDGQTPPNGQQSPQQPITVVGCVTRNGAVDVDKGVRRLNMEPDGLALTTARIVGGRGDRTSAVPGSSPEGSNSGTIPQGTIVGGRTGDPETTSFALSGDQVTALSEQIGRRVEVVGRLTQAQSTGVQPRGTSGSSREAAPVPGAGTREERPGEGSAHPSTELPKIVVLSFRQATGACP